MTQRDTLMRSALAAHRAGALDEAKRLYRKILETEPTNEMACGNLAIIAAQQGEFVTAEALFRRQIELRPGNAANFRNLGLALLQQARLDAAIEAYRHAITLDPDNAASHFSLGTALDRSGDFDAAVASYGRAAALNPDFPEVVGNIGTVLQKQGRSDEAVAAYHRAIELRPDYAEAHFNLGSVLHGRLDLEGAEAAYRTALRLQPANAAVFNNLGAVLLDQGRYAEATDAFSAALRFDPGFAEAHHNLGAALQRQSKLEEALSAYRQALRIRDGYVEAMNNAGIVLQLLGQTDEAIALYRQIIELDPASFEAHGNLGAACLAQGNPGAALAALKTANACKADIPEILYNLGNAWRELGDIEQAIGSYSRALALNPRYDDAFCQLAYHRWQACDWRDYAADQSRLLRMVDEGSRVPPFFLLATPASAADQLRAARNWAASVTRPALTSAPGRIDGDRRIRLGYLSGDFHQHATPYLMAELFERHDRNVFEVFAYSYGPDDASPMRSRIERAFDHFVDVGPMSHRDAAERIRKDDIDILIDLKGYTYNARPQIAAHRPASVQVSYLGYPATMGCDFIDYQIVDAFVVPPDQQDCFSEALVHLPGCYQVNDATRAIDAPMSREDCGLPHDAFVFCSFNRSYKIAPAVFDIWMRLLGNVPESVLWLLETNDLAKRNLCAEARKRGIDADRLKFAPVVPPGQHLARHRHADLFLDTLPCNAHTTASDAIWAGLPLLTCAGDTFAGRVAGSLLMACGLPELVTNSLADYEARAMELAQTPQALAALRDRLGLSRDPGGPFDTPRTVARIEAAFRQMWSTWRSRAPAAPFAVADR
jgi:protein O-GlcNAc transferase